MSETPIIVPAPEAPPEPTDPAHTCEGWVQVPKGTRPECARCKARLADYRQRAAGHGTVEEIREAISALEQLRGQTPLGTCVRWEHRGLRVWVCPRSINLGPEHEPIPLLEIAPNRGERRRLDRFKKRRRR